MKRIAPGSKSFRHQLSLLLLLGLPMTGCNSHVIYVHNASLGVDVNVSAESGTAKFALGYDRETFAVVPRVAAVDEKGNAIPAKQDAMSLVSVSNVDAVGLNELIFNHAVATGQAAVTVAKDPAGLKAMRKAVFGDEGR